MSQQVHQQRNGRRTDSLDDVKRDNIQLFLLGVEESSQQRKRTLPPLDQGGFGGGADLGVVGEKAICPVTYQGGISGKTRLRLGQRGLGQCDRLAEAGRNDYCESMFRND